VVVRVRGPSEEPHPPLRTYRADTKKSLGQLFFDRRPPAGSEFRGRLAVGLEGLDYAVFSYRSSCSVLFGLSMDYEVFLVSRMHEEWLKTRDRAKAINRGQAITGRTVTALAIIMAAVFLAFVLSTDRTIKMIGLGMATAIILDALLVRTVLVPAIMHTLGDANWRLPAWLIRRIPHLDIEGDAVAPPVNEEVPVPA
jgi:hypothetical protein